jgi:hypothetical protein
MLIVELRMPANVRTNFAYQPDVLKLGAIFRRSEFSNVVISRSMNHKGVDFLILARPGRDQWTVVISYPASSQQF